MSEEKYSNEDSRELVPGSTAGPSSPGFLGPSAGTPPPPFFGSTQPTLPSYMIPQGFGYPGAFTGMTPGMGMGPGTGMEPGAGMGMMPGAGMGMMPGAGGMGTMPGAGMGTMPGAGTMGVPGTLPGPIAPLPQGEIPGAVPGTAPGLGLQRPTAEDYLYTQGYLTTQIGRNVRIEFLVGDNTTTDRRGTLVGVGIDFVLIRLEQTDDLLVADLYSIKFVTTYL